MDKRVEFVSYLVKLDGLFNGSYRGDDIGPFACFNSNTSIRFWRTDVGVAQMGSE
jgi:hypothetical protein